MAVELSCFIAGQRTGQELLRLERRVNCTDSRSSGGVTIYRDPLLLVFRAGE